MTEEQIRCVKDSLSRQKLYIALECIESLEKENERLRKQVDKMKNARNCQTWNEWQCPYARDNKDKDYNLITDREKCPCDKWRIKE